MYYKSAKIFSLSLLLLANTNSCLGGSSTSSMTSSGKPSIRANALDNLPTILKNYDRKTITGETKIVEGEKKFDDVSYQLDFTWNGKEYQAKFPSSRVGTIQLFKKELDQTEEIPLPDTIASFQGRGSKYFITYLNKLTQSVKEVTPKLNVYNFTLDGNNWGPKLVVQNAYLSDQFSTFKSHMEAFQKGQLNFLIIPINSMSTPENESLHDHPNLGEDLNTEFNGHMQSAFLFKDAEGKIHITFACTTVFPNPSSYKQCMEDMFQDQFVGLYAINTLLRIASLSTEGGIKEQIKRVLIPQVRDAYVLDSEGKGYVRKEDMEASKYPIARVCFNLTKQFGIQGCGIAAVRLINHVLASQQHPCSLRTICKEDVEEIEVPYDCEIPCKNTYTYATRCGDQCTLLDEQIKNGTSSAVILKRHTKKIVTISREASTPGDICQEAMARIMLYLNHPAYDNIR